MIEPKLLGNNLVVLALLGILLAFSGCRSEEQVEDTLEEEVSTLATAVQATEQAELATEVPPTAMPSAVPTIEPTLEPQEADDEEVESTEMTEFVNDQFSITYPAKWVVLEQEDGSGLLLANSQEGLQRFQKNSGLLSGDQLLRLSLTPASLFQALFIPIESGATAVQLSETILAKLSPSAESGEDATVILTLVDGREVALRKSAHEGVAGAVVVFELTDGIIALSTIAAHSGEYEAAEDGALSILSSLEFLGTAESLTTAIDPAPSFNFMNQ